MLIQENSPAVAAALAHIEAWSNHDWDAARNGLAADRRRADGRCRLLLGLAALAARSLASWAPFASPPRRSRARFERSRVSRRARAPDAFASAARSCLSQTPAPDRWQETPT
jgi:hypothetical protein